MQVKLDAINLSKSVVLCVKVIKAPEFRIRMAAAILLIKILGVIAPFTVEADIGGN